MRQLKSWVGGICFGIAVLALLPETAMAKKLGFGFAGDLMLSKPTGTVGGNDLVASNSLGYGGGLLLEYPLNDEFKLELDGLYQIRNVETTNPFIATFATTTRSQSIQVPLLLRFRAFKLFNLGFGGYFQQGIGNLRVKNEDAYGGTVASSSSNATYEERGLKKREFGLVGALGMVFKAGGSRLLTEVRYVRGLSNLATDPANTFKSTDIQFLVGLKFNED